MQIKMMQISRVMVKNTVLYLFLIHMFFLSFYNKRNILVVFEAASEERYASGFSSSSSSDTGVIYVLIAWFVLIITAFGVIAWQYKRPNHMKRQFHCIGFSSFNAGFSGWDKIQKRQRKAWLIFLSRVCVIVSSTFGSTFPQIIAIHGCW